MSDAAVAERPLIVASVHMFDGFGLTQEVESLLKNNPRRQFTLREILSFVRVSAHKAAVQSILHKAVHLKACVIQGRVDHPLGRGKSLRLIVKCYKWRLPSDGP